MKALRESVTGTTDDEADGLDEGSAIIVSITKNIVDIRSSATKRKNFVWTVNVGINATRNGMESDKYTASKSRRVMRSHPFLLPKFLDLVQKRNPIVMIYLSIHNFNFCQAPHFFQLRNANQNPSYGRTRPCYEL
mmetsp:Transcript_12012/g.17779  ORF Transcript_12012/g.17779 Transcript_12012/m.17779 type:complete len:135 (+) Transcript_12012:7190-7594(+)